MACSHCDAPVSASGAAPYRSHLYHTDCRHCFLCSEEDLQAAQTFKGVIFCGACAKRIFGERARRRPRGPASPRVRPPRRTRRACVQAHTQTVYYANTILASVGEPSHEIAVHNTADIKKEHADSNVAAVSRHVVQAADRSHVQLDTGDMPTESEFQTNEKGRREHKSTAADVGLEELGASVQLVQVTLRRPSAATLVIKSGSGFDLDKNKSLSHDFEGASGRHSTSPCTSRCERAGRGAGRGAGGNARLCSAIKILFALLKQNILDKRFVASVHDCTDRRSPTHGLRDIFHDEISNHHRRGERVLYNTIQRRSKPHVLGWVCAATGTKNKRCRHSRVHSYRCLRAHVMRRAGPTRSDLQQFRGGVKGLLTGRLVGRLLREANLTNVRAG